MKQSEQIALVCDYLRSKGVQVAEYVDYAVAFEDVCHVAESNSKANSFLDCVESMNGEAIGSIFTKRLLDKYFDQACQWKREQWRQAYADLMRSTKERQQQMRAGF